VFVLDEFLKPLLWLVVMVLVPFVIVAVFTGLSAAVEPHIAPFIEPVMAQFTN
jgi:hypothetical protein